MTLAIRRDAALTLATLLSLCLLLLPPAPSSAAPAGGLDSGKNAPKLVDAPNKPKFGAWDQSKEVRGTDDWYMYTWTDPRFKKIAQIIITNMIPESVERGVAGGRDRLTFRMNNGGRVRLAGNRGLWFMTQTEGGGIRQQMGAIPKFEEHPIDRYQRLVEKEPGLTLKRYIETDPLLKAAVARRVGGRLPDAPARPRRGAEAVDADQPLGPQLDRAVMTGDVAQLRALLKLGADVNEVNDRGETPLHRAVALGQAESVAVLLEADAKPDAADQRKQTPLHAAVSRNYLRIARLLLDAGADANQTDRHNRTLLQSSVRSNHITMCELLLKHGAKTDGKDRMGYTALHIAADANHTELVSVLLDAGADVNETDTRGQTALHQAVRDGNLRVVRLLLDADARTDIADRFRKTPLQSAIRLHRHEIADLLHEHDAPERAPKPRRDDDLQ